MSQTKVAVYKSRNILTEKFIRVQLPCYYSSATQISEGVIHRFGKITLQGHWFITEVKRAGDHISYDIQSQSDIGYMEKELKGKNKCDPSAYEDVKKRALEYLKGF